MAIDDDDLLGLHGLLGDGPREGRITSGAGIDAAQVVSRTRLISINTKLAAKRMLAGKGVPAMIYRSLLALADGSDNDRQTLAFATELACIFSAQVQIAPAASDAAYDMVDFGTALGAPYTPAVAEAVASDKVSRLQTIEATCRQACQDRRVAYGENGGLPRLRIVNGTLTPWLNLSRCASLADLVIVGQDYLSGELHVRGVLDDLLLRLRAPVFLARGAAGSLVGTVAVAWDGSHEAGRAVRAAMPLLRRAARVVVLQNKPGVSDFDHDPDPGALTAYLTLHGVARTHIHTAASGGAAQTLLAMAADEGVELLVAGAYGHSKTLERLLGGVTQALVEASNGPSLLLAH